MSNTEHIQQSTGNTAAIIITHAQSKAVKQAHIRTSSLLCYNYYNGIPRNTDLTPATPNTNTSSGTVTQKPRIGSYELNKICPTLLIQQKALSKAQDYRREMSSHTSPASCKLPKAVPNEASQQEESSATTLTSVGAIYRQQSEKISSGRISVEEFDYYSSCNNPIPTAATVRTPSTLRLFTDTLSVMVAFDESRPL
ncbi:hypothetical protein F511_15810 [Dorcoceras hygrometricum]|uniref:Uncharacterized protein n=1 Tax=Dorcoceras hygrometricum TaxID=472368 RepID=A0A2Z7DAU4_9LAMI|nr:hypothetical protein F511_15810 [Dorcoceras hygrometricum]